MSGGGAVVEGEREGEAASDVGLNLTTRRSQPEPKPEVGTPNQPLHPGAPGKELLVLVSIGTH